MLHDVPSFINVRAAGERCCSADTGAPGRFLTTAAPHGNAIARQLVWALLCVVLAALGCRSGETDRPAPESADKTRAVGRAYVVRGEGLGEGGPGSYLHRVELLDGRVVELKAKKPLGSGSCIGVRLREDDGHVSAYSPVQLDPARCQEAEDGVW